ncbi:hypothetical protein AMTRI_Chr08g210000 [Amborella trichopoda]
MGNCIPKGSRHEDEPGEKITANIGNVHVITGRESWDAKISEASSNDKILVANFSASWCGPCRVIAPFYGELSERYPNLVYLMIDVDEMSELSSSWDIQATPTFIFFKAGKQIDKLVGANKPELEKKIIALVDSVPKCTLSDAA